MRQKELKPLAMAADSAFSCLYLLQVKYGVDTRLQVVRITGNTLKRPTWHKVYEAADGRFYINKYKCRWYLDDFLPLNP